MKRISPIEVVCQIALNRINEDREDHAVAKRADVQKALLEMYPRASYEDIEKVISRAIKACIVKEDGELLIVK